MRVRLCVLVVLCAFLAGCGNLEMSAWDALLQKIVDKDDDALARRFIEAVRKGDYDAAQAMLATDVRGSQADQGLRKLHIILDQGEPIETKLIGYNMSSTVGSGTSRTDLTYQIHYHYAWVAGDVLVVKSADGTLVLGSHFSPIRDSLAVLNQFSLQGKSPLHYAIFGLCFALPLFILYALVLCIRTRMRRKWLWILFILFAIGTFKFDWSTGGWSINPVSVSLLGFGFFKSGPYAPYVFNLGLPLGAAIFLLRRRHLALEGTPPPKTPGQSPDR